MTNTSTVKRNRKEATMEPILLRPEEVAECLGLGRTKVFELLAQGHIESVTVGRSRRVHRDEVHAYVEKLRGERAREANDG